MDYYPRHIYKTVVKSSSSFLYDAPHTVPAYLSLRPIFSWALLRSGSFSPQLIMLKIVTNSIPFGNLSTSLIRTHSSMDRLTFYHQQSKKSGHNLSIRLGHSQIPLWSLSQPTSAFSCANILRPSRCWRIPTLYWVTFSRRHNAHFIPHVSDSPLTKGLWRTLPPLFFSF